MSTKISKEKEYVIKLESLEINLDKHTGGERIFIFVSMSYIEICIWILLISISFAIPTGINDNFTPIDHQTNNVCSIDIDQTTNSSDPHRRVLTNLSAIDFLSSWEQQIVQHATLVNIIQITITLPYNLTNQSILNQRIFILDVPHRQLLASITEICSNESSFFLNYSTVHPLPHDVCLYLLLNVTSTTIFKEIIFCRTIEHVIVENQTSIKHAVGPSGFFILSQCIIILIMMLTICSVQTAREKDLINRARDRLIRSRPFITVFGDKAVARRSNATATTVNTVSNPATTLQAGLRQLALNRHLAFVAPPIEEQVLAVNDLTSTINDRRMTRPSIHRDLIPIKELTKRISVVREHPTNVE